MKILFIMYYPGYVRNLESVIRGLAERGHDVILGFNAPPRDPNDRLAEDLRGHYPNVSTCFVPNRGDRWQLTASFVRRCIDYLRYLDPAYDDAPALKARIAGRVPGFVRFIYSALRLHDSESRRRRMHRFLLALEQAIPTDREIDGFLRQTRPDAVVVTPLIDFDSKQVDWVKSAQAQGLPTCLTVYSWDNLTNKGHMRLVPDRVVVWNGAQRDEAVRFHGVPEERVVVTGAQTYDKWFDRAPTIAREAFMASAELDPSKPYLLYLCSSPFIGGTHEPELVRDWIAALRASGDPALREVGIMVRPHPQNARVWDSVDLSGFGNVSIFPHGGANPVDEARRADFFHSLYFSSAVVGINTSAMIEAGIVGRTVLTIRDPRFQATQEGTLHFRHLVREGLVRIADSIEDSVALSAQALAGELFDKERSAAFLTAFIRPHGLDVPATPRYVEALESLGSIRPRPPKRTPLRNALLRMLIAPAEWFGRLKAGKRATKAKKRPQAKGKASLDKKKRKGAAVSAKRGRGVVRLCGGVTRALGIESFVKGHVLPHLIMAALGDSKGGDSGMLAALESEIGRELDRVAEGDGPIIVGPWTSEVGFELLYWIPFVRCFAESRGVDPKRLFVVSRGGSRCWYGELADGGYLDAFDLQSVATFRSANETAWADRGLQKQVMASPLDDGLIAAAQERLGGEQAQVLHPETMYRLFSPFWSGKAGRDLVTRHSRSGGRLDLPPLPEGVTLPERFVAVRLYFRPSFPDTAENREAARRLVAQLAEHHSVVVLETAECYDDHDSLALGGLPGILRLAPPRAEGNLSFQSAVIARASALVCTYGGLAYLGPRYGVPTFGLCSERERVKLEHHLIALADPAARADIALFAPAALNGLLPEVLPALLVGNAD
ncbi:UDP-N-acetyl glucosamine 2-epimerase [Tistlia consotensis]|nr:UDP-N-acetyl glucosamine 2-epimerase [Tistlia consotensis]